MVDRMKDVSQTQEQFNAAIKEVCKTLGIEKFHESKYLETYITYNRKSNEPKQCINTWQITEVSNSTK